MHIVIEPCGVCGHIVDDEGNQVGDQFWATKDSMLAAIELLFLCGEVNQMQQLALLAEYEELDYLCQTDEELLANLARERAPLCPTTQACMFAYMAEQTRAGAA